MSHSAMSTGPDAHAVVLAQAALEVVVDVLALERVAPEQVAAASMPTWAYEAAVPPTYSPTIPASVPMVRT